jgi:hypothetical protein
LPNLSVEELNQLNYDLNIHLEKEEILKCIKKHKNNKASGEDIIINEYIKATSDQFIVVYEKLFNLIFELHHYRKGRIPTYHCYKLYLIYCFCTYFV